MELVRAESKGDKPAEKSGTEQQAEEGAQREGAAGGAEEQAKAPLNLLDVVLSRLKVDVDDGRVTSRLMLAGALTSQESSRGLFETLLGEEWGHATATFTGALVETPKNFVHFLEGPAESLMKYAGDVLRHQESYDTVKDIVVATYTDDVPRVFSKWVHVEQALQGGAVVTSRAKLKVLIVDVVVNLTELGSVIYQKEKLQMMQCLASLKQTNPEILPPINTIEAMYTHAGKEFCLTLGEFHSVYAKAVDLKLNNELIWPPPPPLNY